MTTASQQGNQPERWEKLLQALDEKMQFGLLDYLRRVDSYHFESDVLYLESSTVADVEYLQRDSVRQQLQLLGQDAVGIRTVVINHCGGKAV